MTGQQKLYLAQLLERFNVPNQPTTQKLAALADMHQFVDELCEAAVVNFALAAERAPDVHAHVKGTLGQYEAFGLLGAARVKQALPVDPRPTVDTWGELCCPNGLAGNKA